MTTPPEYPLGPPLIGALIRMPMEAVAARIIGGLHAAGFTDLVPAHFPVLRYPGPEGRRPSELAQWLRDAELELTELTGLTYNPFSKRYRLDPRDVSVNYLLRAVKPA